MVMAKPDIITVNMDDMPAKRSFQQYVGQLRGRWEISLRRVLKTRTLNANRWYFSECVTPFMFYLREAWGDPSIDKDEAHFELKRAVLGMRTKLNEETGEVMELPHRTHTMDKADFLNYTAKAVEFLATSCYIAVVSSDEYWESKEQAKKQKRAA